MAERDLSPTSTSSTLSNITVRTDKQGDARATSSASPSISTPPTSLGDEASVISDMTKIEQAVEVYNQAPDLHILGETSASAHTTTPGAVNNELRRPARSSRKSVTTYNVQILAGTAIHTPTKYLEKHHKNVVHGSLQSITDKDNATLVRKKMLKRNSKRTEASDQIEEQLASEAAQAARRRPSSRVTDLRKEVLRKSGDTVASIYSGGKSFLESNLRRSSSDSFLRSEQSASSTASLKRSGATMEDGYHQPDSQEQEKKIFSKPKSKVWLKQGLYVGQDRDFDPRLSESQNRAKKRAKKPRQASILPLPIFACERLLNEDPRHVFRDFKLPFDTYSPLPRKVKVDGWVKLNKNRFIGDASALWKRDKQDSSQCYCDEEDGCGEACHNRIMAYECDNTNCPLPPQLCNNRPFAELKRRAKGNRYDYGVEVLDTKDRGFGVRAMRTFEPHQIIVEYAGEIITQSECERRMKQVYKKDKVSCLGLGLSTFANLLRCYYLMSFDNKMIIDATRGTIARFVNHSCEPNCEMIKWTVCGEPRMALFAGPRGIMTGDELTYDYNFDPFSQKNIQECRCGTESCRGVLGPKPKKPIEEKSITSALITGTKRKLQNLLGPGRSGSESSQSSPKRRRMLIGNSANAKATNAFARSESARERAEREADELSRQNASRENRALRRSNSETIDKRTRSANPRTAHTFTVKSTRHTTLSFQRKVPRPGALKKVKRPSRLQSNGKAIRPQRPSTPNAKRSIEVSDLEHYASPNISPASLRSATRKPPFTSPILRHPLGKVGMSAGKDSVPCKPSLRSLQGR